MAMDGINDGETFARFERRESKRLKRDGYGATKEFAALDREWNLSDRLAARLAAHVPQQILDKPTQLNLLLRELCDSDAHELALVVVGSVAHSAVYGREDPEMTIDIGRAVQDLAFEKKVLRPEKYSRKVGRAAMQARYRSKEWLIENEVQAGNLLLDFCLSALPDVFQLTRGKKGVKAVKIRDEKDDEHAAILERLIREHPVFAPRTTPPKPWSGWRTRGHGDARERAFTTFVTGPASRRKETREAFEAAFRNGSMQPHIDGIHALESVPYRINEPVLAAEKKYYPEILEAKFQKKLRKLDDRRQIRAHTKQFEQDKRQLKADLATAERFKGAPFYIELRCEFRGRVCPVPFFHYQRDKHIRALFLFDRGEPIGSEQAVNRLKDYAAACWGDGWDKKTLPERRHWIDENWDNLIKPTAELKSKDWFDAEDPFLFLAACIELVAAKASAPSYDYLTRLPVSFDGLTNGFVHYALLTRQDDVGILSPRSTASAAVDLNMIVANEVYTLFGQEDRYRQHNIKLPSRRLAKRPTGTLPYGATGRGRQEQIRDILEDDDDVLLPSDWKGAAKLCYAIGEDHRKAIEGKSPAAIKAMKYLRSIAGTLAKRGRWLQWANPTGFLLISRYHKDEYRVIESKLRGARVTRKIAVDKLVVWVAGSRNSAPPNIIHSLDSAHMMLTAAACEREGISLMGIHDCYAVLASRAEQVNGLDSGIIRQALFQMYDGRDYLTEIRNCALRIASGERGRPSKMADALSQHPLASKARRVEKVVGTKPPNFPPVPELGDLDLRAILKSVYIFSS
jgi:DNA-directed RNA polymerase